MDIEFFRPISLEDFPELDVDGNSTLFSKIQKNSLEEGFPNLADVKIAVFGVLETRGQGVENELDLNFFREQFYSLFSGNWKHKIADLGDILPGETINDTYEAVKRQQQQLLKKGVIGVVLGGSQDLVYAQYRGYDSDKMLNLVNIDSRFDLGDASGEITSSSYIGKMVTEAPFQLNNYANLGYQTYYQDQAEIDLLEKLFFEAHRLGELGGNIHTAEPILRDADLASIDVRSIGAAHVFSAQNPPNGFTGREICALARYAGLGEKLTSFGVFHLNDLDINQNSYMLAAQIMWYFIEGVNQRKHETEFVLQPQNYLTYRVPVNDEVLVFYKSKITSRWWLESKSQKKPNNKLKPIALLPCAEQDYLDACNQVVPERWWKAQQKNHQ
jgi:hypothetical protein